MKKHKNKSINRKTCKHKNNRFTFENKQHKEIHSSDVLITKDQADIKTLVYCKKSH